MAKNVEELITKLTNKYNLIPSKDIRSFHSGSMSQEIGSTYDHLSDLYGIDLNDLVYGEKGFMKSKYPEGFPDFKGDVVYSEKYWNELEDWANKEKGINFNDRNWERYKLDPDYYEQNTSPAEIKRIREYGASLEPQHAIHKRPMPDFRW